MKRMFLVMAMSAVVFGGRVRNAEALTFQHFEGGPMKNLYVDLVFWGNNFTASDRQAVRQGVTDVANFLSSGWVSNTPPPAGMEAAIHYYGTSGIIPGMWIDDPMPIPSNYMPPSTGALDDGQLQPIVALARNGTLGPAFDYNNNVASSSGLPVSTNRLALVITKGTNNYCVSLHRASGCLAAGGYHDSMSGQPYGAVMFEAVSPGLSHEIMEAMSDPYVFNGWKGDPSVVETNEIADECANQSGGEFALITVDSGYTMSGVNTQGATCMQTIPEAHAPMAATFGFGGNGTVPLTLVYVDTNGHVQGLVWQDAGRSATGPFDLGQPSPTVKAAGKPTLLDVMNMGGQYIFVKGTDTAVWMRHNNTWTSLGGQIHGEPSAVSWTWNNGLWIHVAVLAVDDHLCLNAINSSGTPSGWGQVPSNGSLFVGPPNLVSRAADSLDVFAVGEDGQLKWIRFANPNWMVPVTISHDKVVPFVSKPAVVKIGANGLEVFAVGPPTSSGPGMFQTSYDGSTWSSMFQGQFNLPADDYKWGYQGTPAVVTGTGGRVDVFAVARSSKLWWFDSHTEPHGSHWYTGTAAPGGLQDPPLVSGGATGDPVVVSRGAGQLEVFYRTNDGRLGHKTTTNSGTTWTTEGVLPASSIQ
jgi:hypothetical protein